ncbi:hypothetical protein EAI_01976 [Harpegnathos saltator]|uniref:Zinc finger HIT domain-containing protein 2 n=2 Tax=Harpegnathos saltator TaxID=610380 RepID=E2B3H6_HARSA|nr:hypothetical protein EAI_01976 [Harpegnathos saltator]
MLEILKRQYYDHCDDNFIKDNGEDNSDEEGSPLDSDDEEEVADLKSRLQNIDLDDSDQLWSALSNTERQEFEALIKNGEADKLLPEWIPWWTHRVKKKLVQPIEEDATDAFNDLKYPALIDVPLFNELKKASPCVYFNIINVIYAYAYIALYYNGDYLDCVEDAANDFLTICMNMKNNKVFNNAESAIQSVTENVKNVNSLPGDKQTLLAFKDAGASILQGPVPEVKTIYTSAALSELHRLLTAAKKEILTHKNIANNREFSRKFLQKHSPTITLSEKTILLCLKKLEYYLAWVKSHEVELQSIVCD